MSWSFPIAPFWHSAPGACHFSAAYRLCRRLVLTLSETRTSPLSRPIYPASFGWRHGIGLVMRNRAHFPIPRKITSA